MQLTLQAHRPTLQHQLSRSYYKYRSIKAVLTLSLCLCLSENKNGWEVVTEGSIDQMEEEEEEEEKDEEEEKEGTEKRRGGTRRGGGVDRERLEYE